MKYKRKFEIGQIVDGYRIGCVHNAIEKYLEEEEITEDCIITYAFAHYVGAEEDIEIDKLDNANLIMMGYGRCLIGGEDISRLKPELLLIYGHTFVREVVLTHGAV